MPTIQTVYSGQLRTLAKHVFSGKELITDAPVDNMGKGESFSPTDLLAASLGSCMLTVMGIAADAHNISIDGTTVSITKIMASDPRRVSQIQVEFILPPNSFLPKHKKILEQAALECPVALSLHPSVKQQVTFTYS